MINLSSAMAGEFSNTATEFTAAIRALGPNPLRLQPQELAPKPIEG
jgi:coenzyme F420-reducing hydrogenase delta subunit